MAGNLARTHGRLDMSHGIGRDVDYMGKDLPISAWAQPWGLRLESTVLPTFLHAHFNQQAFDLSILRAPLTVQSQETPSNDAISFNYPFGQQTHLSGDIQIHGHYSFATKISIAEFTDNLMSAAATLPIGIVELTDENIIDSLLITTRWAATTISFSFPASQDDYLDANGDYNIRAGTTIDTAEPKLGFQQVTTLQMQAVRLMLTGESGGNTDGGYNAVSSFVNLAFTDMGTGDAVLRYGESTGLNDPTFRPEVAHAWTPWVGNPVDGDVWLNYYISPDDPNFTISLREPWMGDFAWFTILHETGHALGLKHPHQHMNNPLGDWNFSILNPAIDTIEMTVMSYASVYNGPGTPPSNLYAVEEHGYPTTFMAFDILALQYLYGVDWSTNSTDTVYTWSPTTGQMFINGVGQGAPMANRVFLTIWDGGGNDTYDMSNYTGPVRVDLRSGANSMTSDEQRAILDTSSGRKAAGTVYNSIIYIDDTRPLIENGKSGSGDDTLFGNQLNNVLDGGAGVDGLDGFEGNDTLLGGAGNDFLHGGPGGDLLNGGDGFDLATYHFATSGVVASLLTPTANTGDAAGDTYVGIEGLDGSLIHDDDLSGNAGDNAVGGRGGNDTLWGLEGSDTLSGGDGNDYAHGGLGADMVFGDAGNDSLDGGDGNDALSGGDGNDTLNGGGLSPLTSSDQLLGGDGDDLLIAGGRAWDADGGWGDDTFLGGAGNDQFVGGEGSDYASTGDGNDSIWGGDGQNTSWYDGPDTILSGGGDDLVIGLIGNDSIDCGDGNDLVWGEIGSDTIYGGSGVDTIIGGLDADVMVGGQGGDFFRYGNMVDSSPSAPDLITDFSRAQGDKIDVWLIDPSTKNGDQSFAFIGTSAFAGGGKIQVRYSQTGGNTLIEFDTGDGLADMAILLSGSIALAKTDFIL